MRLRSWLISAGVFLPFFLLFAHDIIDLTKPEMKEVIACQGFSGSILRNMIFHMASALVDVTATQIKLFLKKQQVQKELLGLQLEKEQLQEELKQIKTLEKEYRQVWRDLKKTKKIDIFG